MDSDTISKILFYNPKTGVFFRVKKRRKRKKPLGCIKPSGHRSISIKGKTYRASHLAWLWMRGEWPSHSIRHLNGDNGDDRWRNLKLIGGPVEMDISRFIDSRPRGMPRIRSEERLAKLGLIRLLE